MAHKQKGNDFHSRAGILLAAALLLAVLLPFFRNSIKTYLGITVSFLGLVLVYLGYYGGFAKNEFPKLAFGDFLPVSGQKAKIAGVILILLGLYILGRVLIFLQ